jgi:hypothetical protein
MDSPLCHSSASLYGVDFEKKFWARGRFVAFNADKKQGRQ